MVLQLGQRRLIAQSRNRPFSTRKEDVALNRPAHTTSHVPARQGLYDPADEHDACGVAFVVDMHGRQTHRMVQQGLDALVQLDHRGATGAEANVGDGAGILTQIPDRFFRDVCEFELPERYAVGLAFLPADDPHAASEAIDKLVKDQGLTLLGWRDVPVDASTIGSMASDVQPVFRHLFVAAAPGADQRPDDDMGLERAAFVLRKRIEHEAGIYFASLSCRTIIHKGMLTSGQVQEFFTDLSDERFESALALVHSRFSTNTFPSWPLAHPYRLVAHNGEINTVK
ncbi:MAG: glutamate synthase (NADPH/NADH) large chain, partial [Glaciecola sp.]